MKVFVLDQQITSVKQKEMSRHGGMNTRIKVKILNQLNTSEGFLIINSNGKYFSRHEIAEDLRIINDSSETT